MTVSFKKLTKSAAILLGSGITAQIVSFCGVLVVARLYSPEQVGTFSLIVATTTIMASVAGARFDLAIVTEQTAERAAVVAKLTVVLTALFAFVAELVCAVAFAVLKGGAAHSAWHYGILFIGPIGLAMGLNMVGVGCLTRSRYYGMLAANQVVIAVGTLAAQLLYVVFLPSAIALPAAFLTGQLAGLSLMLNAMSAYLLPIRVTGGARTLRRAAIDAKAYPLHTVPYSFASQVYTQLPQLLVGAFYGLSSAGQFSTAVRVTLAPMVLLPAAIGQVFFAEMARDPQDLRWGKRVAVATAVTGIVISVFVAAVLYDGPLIFRLALGNEWLAAGAFAKQIVTASLFAALAAGYDRIFDVFKLQKLRLALILVSLCVMAAALIALGMLKVSLAAFVTGIVTIQIGSAVNWSLCCFRAAGFSLKPLVAAWTSAAFATCLWWFALSSIDASSLLATQWVRWHG